MPEIVEEGLDLLGLANLPHGSVDERELLVLLLEYQPLNVNYPIMFP